MNAACGEVILELSKRYGPRRAFPEAAFFEIFTTLTYPEVGSFFERYVRGTVALPTTEFYDLIGVTYYAEEELEPKPRLGIQGQPLEDGPFKIIGLAPEMAERGFQVGDVVTGLNGTQYHAGRTA